VNDIYTSHHSDWYVVT